MEDINIKKSLTVFSPDMIKDLMTQTIQISINGSESEFFSLADAQETITNNMRKLFPETVLNNSPHWHAYLSSQMPPENVPNNVEVEEGVAQELANLLRTELVPIVT